MITLPFALVGCTLVLLLGSQQLSPYLCWTTGFNHFLNLSHSYLNSTYLRFFLAERNGFSV